MKLKANNLLVNNSMRADSAVEAYISMLWRRGCLFHLGSFSVCHANVVEIL